MVVLWPGCTRLTHREGNAVLTHPSLETHHQPMPSSQHSSSSISLCSSWQLPEAPSQLQSQCTPGCKRANPPRTHPLFMGSNLRPEWVTEGTKGSQGGWTMELDVCLPFLWSALVWSSLPACARLSNPFSATMRGYRPASGLAVSSPLSIGFI